MLPCLSKLSISEFLPENNIELILEAELSENDVLIKSVSIDAKRKTVGGVLMGYINTLRIETLKRGKMDNLFYNITYKQTSVGKLFYSSRTGYKLSMTHRMNGGQLQELDSPYKKDELRSNNMLRSLGIALKKLGFVRAVRQLKWKLESN